MLFNMIKRIVAKSLLIIMVSIILTSDINAISLEDSTNKNFKIYDRTNNEFIMIENGVIFGITIMTINSKPCGLLEFVNITIEGEVKKDIKSGLFGFFIARVPIGKYYILANKLGFHSSYAYVRLFQFKPFAFITFKLEKKGWNQY